MNINEITQCIKNPENIDEKNLGEIEELLIKYPYFQTGYLLFTKGLLNSNSIRYNQQLKKTASYCYEREQLFKLISLDIKTAELNKNIPKESILEIGKPLNFDKNESYSFSEWLALSEVKKIERNKHQKDNSLIADFIEDPVSIKKINKKTFFKPISAAKESLLENDELITPTLAKVYLEQEHFEKAILAYEKLCLKYPEKNSFFANQIRLINKLKEK